MRAFLIFLIILGFFSAFCQTKTFVGVKAGAGATTAYMQHSVFPLIMEMAWTPGFNAGLQVTHFPEKYQSKINAAVQISVNYHQKGWVQEFIDSDVPNHKTRINYLEIPLEAVGYFGNRNKYYVSAGFFLEYALSANVDDTPPSAEPNEELDLLKVGISDFHRYQIRQDHRFGYGPRGAVGVFRETNSGVFRLEAFFTFSVRSAFDFEPVDSGIPDLSLNYGAGVTIGYMFSFGDLDI